MEHSSYVKFFEDMTKAHKDLRHEEPGEQYPSRKRKSFFRANGQEELVQDSRTQVDMPYLLLRDYTGRLDTADDMRVDDIMTGSFEIRKKVDNAYDWAGIDTARDICKKIGMAIIAEMHRLMLDEGHCGPINDFDLRTVRYDLVGPIIDNHYGWRVAFTYKNEAYNVNSVDLDTEFQRT